MIRRIGIYESASFDPYRNLAVEQYLLEHVAEDQCVLYLWQNENTVVIGRNQNPWKECRTALLQQEGGHLARRLSGGGAVFHDLGNLNFTFLMPQAAYDLDRQLSVIQRAVALCGLTAERSGRNDLLICDRKFSGNAFYKNGRQAYHHGTLLVDANKDKLSRYLSPSPAKLRSKGVDSVRSRVANLREFNPGITVASLKDALIRAFGEFYGCVPERLCEDRIPRDVLIPMTEHNRSRDWLFGRSAPMEILCEGQFDWGGLQLSMEVKGDALSRIKVYTDAMDWQLSSRLEACLSGCPLAPEPVRKRLADSGISGWQEIFDLILRSIF